MPMKGSVEVAKETTGGMPMKQEPMKGYADETGADERFHRN
jgi:hypothetical protein